MMSQEQNDHISRTGPKTAAGKLLRMYWQPAALLDELDGSRPIKPVKLLGESLVLFRDDRGHYGLLDRDARIAVLIWPLAGSKAVVCAAHFMDGSSTSRGNALRRQLNLRVRLYARTSSSVRIRSLKRAELFGPILARESRRHFRKLTVSRHLNSTRSRSRD
ncbi:hypothetical protein ABIF44_004143 [Bradyrhizobium japonicum]|jgi:hypothetical protein|nr:hypothetical protein [Bradyrhizobium japonicum]MCS3989554.1 hypothetical protein [Bradyrhizobium japonicum]MCS4015630.1 hypothetical protein [Bradyrhizobium japonicum]MCS4202726.1 hypothetical protein [Bradyrhizobium japonicum]MDH6175625.1 hypothetical protein [Bradyrhizobium japonicum]